jgi:DNA-binding transcriptional regulator YiaG
MIERDSLSGMEFRFLRELAGRTVSEIAVSLDEDAATIREWEAHGAPGEALGAMARLLLHGIGRGKLPRHLKGLIAMRWGDGMARD